jgi:hypothetical protein
VELPSPGSGCNRTKPDTTTDRPRHGIAQSHATIGRCRGLSDRDASDGLRPAEGAGLGASSVAEPNGDPSDADATPFGDPHADADADGDANPER